ncbi:MAG: SMI1/KNR4 family protein [Clostridiales bacterium]|nr:SMI1/KNR4 family protein [Clostridiales bacterium]
MFSGKVTVKIEKDKNTLQYIKIIRNYDNNLPLSDIKKTIENGDVVFSFDSDDNPLISNGNDNSIKFKEDFFIKALKDLKKAGAKVFICEEKWGHEYKEFSTAKITTKGKKQGQTDDSVMKGIEQKWNLPQQYLDYLKTHPESQELDIKVDETEEMIPIMLYGANDLIKCQDGYAYNPVEKKIIEDWDPNLVVIADSDADPYCIDISQNISPVLFAMHGMDEWSFDEYFVSLEIFFESLGIK